MIAKKIAETIVKPVEESFEKQKQFVSDASHELKTPIALIQGYAEGLVDNVAADEDSKMFYSEVILDEANKMDKLVKRLLELMKLEYGDRKFNDHVFDLTEVINEVIRNCKVMLEEKLNADGLTFIQNNGDVQEVKHFHLHLKPYYKNNTISDVKDIYELLKGRD